MDEGKRVLRVEAQSILDLGDALAAKAVQRMEEYSITSLFVFNQPGDKAPVGVIHLHDLLKAGVV